MPWKLWELLQGSQGTGAKRTLYAVVVEEREGGSVEEEDAVVLAVSENEVLPECHLALPCFSHRLEPEDTATRAALKEQQSLKRAPV